MAQASAVANSNSCEAEQRLERLDQSRLELLLGAAGYGEAEPLPCQNGGGNCSRAYEEVLAYQSFDSATFCHWIFEALEHGRQKGNAVMLVGPRDTGKTTVTEPAAMIYKTMECPQADSFCPLEGIRGHELILWHDFRYAPGHPKKEEQGMRLDQGTFDRLLEGLPTRIGVPKSDGARRDFTYSENAAFIFTGPFFLTAYKNGAPDSYETDQLACRFKYVHFARPAPPSGLDRSFKSCPCCWAKWILRGELRWRVREGRNVDGPLAVVAAADGGTPTPQGPPLPLSEPSRADTTPPDLIDRLRQLIAWRTAGHLSDAEFQNAKQALGL